MKTVTYYFDDLEALLGAYPIIEKKIFEMSKAINHAYSISSGTSLDKRNLSFGITANDDVIAEIDKFGYNKK